MKDLTKMSRKELEAEIRHCWNEQQEYAKEIHDLKAKIELFVECLEDHDIDVDSIV